MKPLVIGIGNPLRGDDGVGQVVVQTLADRLPPDAATLRTVHQLTPELATDLADASHLILVDASVALPPGQVQITCLEDTAPPQLVGHHLTPTELRALAKLVYGRVPPTVCVAVGLASTILDAPLSTAVAEQLERIVASVMGLLALKDSDIA
jgi:hydrogenase maturation protease